MRAQSSTSYLVVFGVVMIVALVAIYIITSNANANKQLLQQSKIYWASVQPISITDFSLSPDGKIGLVLMDRLPKDVRIVKVRVGDETTGYVDLVPVEVWEYYTQGK